MKKTIKIISIIAMCVVVAVTSSFVLVTKAADGGNETNAFAGNFYIGETDHRNPFFDKVLPDISKNIAKNNKKSVTPHYDSLPKSTNTENFQGLGSTTYANINGQTVTVEAFLRNYGDSLHDPNNGMGLLIYQCIQYKRKHPNEDVKIKKGEIIKKVPEDKLLSSLKEELDNWQR